MSETIYQKIKARICGRWHHGYKNVGRCLDDVAVPRIECTADLYRFLDSLSDANLLNVLESQVAELF